MDEEDKMAKVVTAIYEGGVLRLLTPISLPERTRVRVQILPEAESGDELRRAEVTLIAAGLIRPELDTPPAVHVSQARREELRRLYSTGEALSDSIIRGRDEP